MTTSCGGDRLRSRNPCEAAAVTAWITGGSGSCSGSDGGSDADCGTVGIKAEGLSSSSAAARRAGGWSACSSGAPSRSTSVQTRRPRNFWNSTFVSSSGWFWIPGPRDSSVVARLHKLAALPKRPAHVHHTLPRCVPMHTPCPTHRPRFHGGFVFHTMMTSSARRTVCVHDAITDGHLGVNTHGGFADLPGFTKACIRRGEIVDGVRRVDVVISQVRGKTVFNPEHELERCGGECAMDWW